MRNITHIIVHCADTYAGMDIGVDEIRKWHVEGNGWDDVGYHYIIRRNGIVEKGRDDNVSGAHARGMNANSLGVCLVGGKGEDGSPVVNFTASQWEALRELCLNLKFMHNANIIGHCDVPGTSKTCPNFNVIEWSKGLGE